MLMRQNVNNDVILKSAYRLTGKDMVVAASLSRSAYVLDCAS